MLRTIYISLVLLCLPLMGLAQSAAGVDSLKKDAVNVFLDCNFCDQDHFRKQMTFLNYVRDRKEAQVHILTAYQTNGAGGGAYTFYFIGQKNFAGVNDTLIYHSKADATDDERREGQLRILKMGLIRYVSKTPYAEQISIDVQSPSSDENVKDKWNSWVFSLDAGAWFNGQQLYNSISSWSSISASRVTEDLKVEFNLNNNYNESRYQIDDTTEIKSINRSKGFNHMLVKSISDHWSVGGYADVNSSDYNNNKLSFAAAPAIEYDLFPYSQATRKQLRMRYAIGYSYSYYNDTTIFNKIEEGLGKQVLAIAFEIKQPWGSLSTNLVGSSFLHNFSLYNVYCQPELNIRVFKGLSIRLGGSISLIHDQISLPKAGATLEEILLQQRQLATQYSYWGNVGISYTFGSIYNNVVNPRFR